VRIAQYKLGYAERLYVSHSINLAYPSVSPGAYCDGGLSLQRLKSHHDTRHQSNGANQHRQEYKYNTHASQHELESLME
jgi:hypothetical protein